MTRPRSTQRRRTYLLVSLAAGLGLGIVPLTAQPALACSCADQLTDDEYAKDADAVFVGRVDALDPPGWFSGSSADPMIATIVVDEVYKGEVHTYTDVVTASSGASCGIDPLVGQTLLIFARYGSDGIVDAGQDELTASLCQGTRVVGAAPIDLAAPGYAPMAGAVEPAGTAFPLLGWITFVAVAGLGAIPLTLWLRLRSMRKVPTATRL